MTEYFYVTLNERRAARAKIELSKRLGKPVEAWVVRVANAEIVRGPKQPA